MKGDSSFMGGIDFAKADKDKATTQLKRASMLSGQKGIPLDYAKFVVDLASAIEYEIIPAKPYNYVTISWTDDRFTVESVLEYLQKTILNHPARATRRDFTVQEVKE
jgi:hypothetical protein